MLRLLPQRTTSLPLRIAQSPCLRTSTPGSARYASLSAIHRGLRRSERVQYGEVRPRAPVTRGRRNDKGDDIQFLTEKALAGAGSKRQQLKLLRKLKKKEDEELGTGRKTRRKRFNDPDCEFGKSSLVYQMKHGSLQHLVDKLDEPVRPRLIRGGFRREPRDEPSARPASKSGRLSSADFTQRFHDGANDGPSRQRPKDSPPRASDARSRRDGIGSQGRQRREAFQPTSSRSLDTSSRRDENIPFGRQRREEGNDSFGPMSSRSRDIFSGRNDSSQYGRPGREERGDAFKVSTPAPRERMGKMMPMTIKYTTAASQFLYGKAVVKAALTQGRRKLYHLYIYGGDNRQDSKDNEVISRLAQRKGVPITIVPTEDQRLMDKMSQGRPHNGFVLETSPIPQLPITALGPLEETPSRLGFRVTVDHQTKEEEAVNGTESFIPRSNAVTAKPYVLLLHEILDPGNLGAILRTASYFGVDAVGITNRSSSKLSPVVLKSAAGAVEEMTIFTVDSPVSFLEESRKAGWVSYAAVAPPDKKLIKRHGGKFISSGDIEHDQPLAEKPCILVLGNEGYGLSKDVKVAADYELSVPRFLQESSIDSLNVGVAAGLLCHSFVKGASQPRTSSRKNETTSKSPEPSEADAENALF